MAESCGWMCVLIFVIFIFDGKGGTYFIQYSGNGYQYKNVFIGKFQRHITFNSNNFIVGYF